MDGRWVSLLVVITALGFNTPAAAQNDSPLPPHATAQIGVLRSDDAASPAKQKQDLQKAASRIAAPRVDPGAVSIAPPIVRYAGTTFLTPDQPLLGRLNLQGPWPSGSLHEQPPPGGPDEVNVSMGADNAVAQERARN